MSRTSASVAACFVALSCAVSDPAQVTPDVTAGLPNVDAGNDPVPAKGTTGAEQVDDASAPPPPSHAPPPPPPSPTNAKPGVADVVITEVMYNPSGPEPKSEWLELWNATSAPLSLDGLTLVDGSGRTHTIASGTTIPANAYVLLARDKATAIAQKVPAAAILYEYGTGLGDTAGILLTNGAAGAITLKDGSTTITDSIYGPLFTQSGGASVQRQTDGSWCLSTKTWTTGSDDGTPGTACDCP
jgi:hypothetical protein